MNIFLIRFLLVLFVSVLGSSATNLVSDRTALFPIFIFAFPVAFSLTRGFVPSLPLVILLGITADIATVGMIGPLAAFAVGLAYTASFFSRRFVVEHRFMANLFSGFLVGAAAFVFPFFSALVFWGGAAGGSEAIQNVLSLGNIVFALVGGAVFFPFALSATRRFESWASKMSMEGQLHG